MTNLIYLSLFLFFCTSSYATDYYVSAAGFDSNTGTSPATAFQSIDKINSVMSSLQPGDKVLFRRGDVFSGQINIAKSGTLASKIVFGAYGTGEIPIISGAKKINAQAWINLGNGFWQVSHIDKITHLFKNDQLQISARFPNVGYTTIDGTNGVQNGNSTITSTALSQAANTWTGATVHVRNQGDAITKSAIMSFSNNTISFAGTGYQIVPNFGFYIDNAESALDSEGEWFWNESTNILKIKSAINPNQFLYEGSFFDHGAILSWSTSNILVQDIKFVGQRKSAINVPFSSNVTIQNCFFKNCFTGIEAGGFTNSEVLNLQIIANVFHDILNSSIRTNPWVNGAIISNNEIKRNALVAGYEDSCLICGQAMSLGGNSNIVSINFIEDCGYSGINYANSNHIIEKNWIKNVGLTKNDCGAIQSWGTTTTNNVIKNNFCSEISGNIDGMPSNYGIIANAIYLDNYQSGSTIENNTCFDSPNADGIFLYSVRDNIIRFNTCYNNRTQISLAERNPTTPPGNEQAAFYVLTTNNTVTNNIGYCLTEKQRAISTFSDYLTTNNFGTFNSNQWFNPYSATIANDNGADYTLQGWRTVVNRDLQSTNHFLKLAAIESVSTIGTNLISNGNFEAGLNGWSTWQGHVNLSVNANSNFGSNALTFASNSGGQQNYGNLQSPNFAIENGSNYILRFKGFSANHHALTLVTAMAESPWSNIATSENKILDNTNRDYCYLFSPTQNQNPARIGFVQNTPSTAYLDDFTLFKYSSIVYEDAKQRSPLFLNATAVDKTIALVGNYQDLQNNALFSSIILPPWSSRILIKSGLLANGNFDVNKDSRFVVYPNPASDFIKILGIENSAKLEIYNTSGALVLKTDYQKNQQLDINLCAGLYIIKIFYDDFKISKKLIVR